MYHILSQSQQNVVGFRVLGRLSSQDYKTLLPFVESTIKAHGTIRIITDLTDFKGIECLAILKSFLFIFKYSSLVEKKAVISDEDWIYKWVKVLRPFFKTEARCFPTSKADEAWEWIRK